MTDTRQVKVTLVIDSSGAVHAMRTVGDESGKTESKFQHLDKGVLELGKSFGGLKTMIGAGLGALGLGGVAYGIKDVVSGMQEMAATTEHFHAVSGIGAQQSLYITAAMKARGVNAETGAKAFGFLTKNLQTAERQWHTYGTTQLKALEKGKMATGLLGVQATAFRELGLNVGALSRMTGEQKLQTVVQAFENMPLVLRKAGEAGRLMKQIFGRGGEGLATVLSGGALGLTAMTKAAKEFFPTLKTGSVEEMKVQTARSNLAFEGLKFTLGQQLLPVLLAVDKWFIQTIRDIKDGHGTWGRLYNDARGVIETLGGLKNVLIGVGAVWGIEKVLAFGSALKGLTIISTITGLLKVITGGDLLLTMQVGFLDAAAGASALLGVLVPLAATAALVYGAVKLLDKVLPAGDRPENLLGGNQPGENMREGNPLTPRRYRGVGRTGGAVRAHEAEIETAGTSSVQILHAIEAIAKEEHTTHVDLHVDAAKVAEALVRNPHSNRKISEGVAHYTSKMAALR